MRASRCCTVMVVVVLGVGRISAGVDGRVADAAEARDAATVQALIADEVDVNSPQPDGATALHWAAHWNDLPTASALIAAGADVNAANEYGVTPLFQAATNRSLPMLDALLDAGANAGASMSSGETVLMRAVRSGSLPAVERLLVRGADVNGAQRSRGQTALMWAATRQRVDIARTLLDSGADVLIRSRTGFSPLMFAAREGSVAMSQLLVEAGDDVSATAERGYTALLVATVRGHVDVAMFLLEQGAEADGDVEEAGYTPLHWAASTAESPLTYGEVEVLGEWRAMAGVPDRDAKLRLIRGLLDHGANIEERIAKPLLAYSTFENRSHIGGTPFYTAAQGGDAGVMRLLLAYGADPLARSSQNWTPLMAATGATGNQLPNIDDAIVVTEEERVAAVDLAWRLGNGLEVADSQGLRAMHIATSAGFHQIITWLLDHGADINAKSNDRVMNVNGRDVTIPGQTPRAVAEGFNQGLIWVRPETAEFLKDLGAISEGRATLATYVQQDTDEVGR